LVVPFQFTSMSSTHSVKQASDQPPLYQNRDTLSATLSLENTAF
jgi:hypothetical protein